MRMTIHEPLIGNAMTLARLAAIVIAFVLGHDAMMAAQPHHGTESHHHEVIEVEECGSTEGIAHVQTGPTVDHPSANFTPAGLYQACDTGASLASDPVFVESDSSTRRAWLQVYLN